jgi:pimeloyl-ACP methyl ester carboxylesterase
MITTAPMPVVDGVTHRTVDAAGLDLHVAEAGHGVPVLMLHGFPQHWYAWRKVIPLLPGCRTICPDLRGFGWSAAPRRGYDVDTLASDVLALLDALELERVYLVGHDWGAKIGFRLCLSRPDRFAGFVALNALHPWPARGPLIRHAWRQWYTALIEYPNVGGWMLRRPALVRFLLRRAVAEPGLWREDELAAFADVLTRPARARAGQALHWQFVMREIPRLLRRRVPARPLPVPTTLLFGARDVTLSPAQLAGVDGLAVQVVPGAGHHLPDERPDLVAGAVLAMLAHPATHGGVAGGTTGEITGESVTGDGIADERAGGGISVGRR